MVRIGIYESEFVKPSDFICFSKIGWNRPFSLHFQEFLKASEGPKGTHLRLLSGVNFNKDGLREGYSSRVLSAVPFWGVTTTESPVFHFLSSYIVMQYIFLNFSLYRSLHILYLGILASQNSIGVEPLWFPTVFPKGCHWNATEERCFHEQV